MGRCAVGLLVVILFVSACGSAPTPSPTAVRGPASPTSTPSWTPTAAVPPTSTPPPATPTPVLYTVRAGDTLATIASRFNTTVQAIAQANDITNVDLIRVGQVLIIPPSVPTPTPAGATPATPLPTTTR